MVDGSGWTTWRYDARGEVKSITGAGRYRTEWSYFSDDRVATSRYPGEAAEQVGETVAYTYHPQGSLNTVVGQSHYVNGTSCDAAGRTDVRQLGAGR